MENKKRDRAANFTKAEVRLLADTVCRYKNILENKKTDAVTNKEKEAAWAKVAQIFNAGSGLTPRNAKTLKLKYEGIKKGTKKKASVHRQELYRTGGGESSAPPFDDVEEKILAICSNIHGMDSRNDSDAIIEPTVILIQEEPGQEIVIQEEPGQEIVFTEEVGGEKGDAGPTKKKVCDENVLKKNIMEMEPDVVVGDSDYKWQSWTPRLLKNKMTPSLKQNVSKSSVCSKLDQLSSARQELVQLQIKLAKQEIVNNQTEHELSVAQKKEEHDARMCHLFNEEKRRKEEHDFKMEQYKNSK